MLGFVVPWVLKESTPTLSTGAGNVAGFFGGYSVRFATGFLERILWALFPDAKPQS
jgi:hypothetical protein